MAALENKAIIDKFFKGRKKNPSQYFFSDDGSSMVTKETDRETSMSFAKYSQKTKEEIIASYEERMTRIREHQELFDISVRALLDARERGARDVELVTLNRDCQRLDSILFELTWAEKHMSETTPIPEIRQLEFDNPYLVNKPSYPVYQFNARRVPTDFFIKYDTPIVNAVEPTSVSQDERGSIPSAILERVSIITDATETRRLDGEEPIEFYYKLENPYKVFSTSYTSPFSLDGKVWPTVTHYFQAQKFPSDPLYQETIRTSKKPEEAIKLGKSIDRPARPDFELYMDDIMRRGLEAKFEQTPPFKQLLLDTGNKTLLHVNPTDSYWGLGKDRKGKNRLGQLLIELRDKIRQTAPTTDTVIIPAETAASAVAVPTTTPSGISVPKGAKIKISSRPPPTAAPAAKL